MYLRDVVEEPTFSEDIDYLRNRYEAIDDVHQWLTWTLSENPRAGERLKFAPDFWLITTPVLADTPSFWVMYRFAPNKIYLHSIEPVTE